jgi:hypothetical protein
MGSSVPEGQSMVASSIFQSRVRWTRLTAFQPGELSGPSHHAFYLFRGRMNPLLHDVRKNMHNSLKIRYIYMAVLDGSQISHDYVASSPNLSVATGAQSPSDK